MPSAPSQQDAPPAALSNPEASLKRSLLAAPGGWVEVEHPRYPNVFALGDASSLPTSKTAAAVRKQAPVLAEDTLSSHAV